jgi:pyruvate dehydrogenase E2 component (dihydrolipoamide acetyltransferase)
MATIIEMPKLSDTMEMGTLAKWLKKPGDTVGPGDSLAEVETDKATMDLENFEEGVLLKCYVSEGEEVPLGAPLCAIGEEGEEAPDVGGNSGTASPARKEEPKEEPASEPAKTESSPEPEEKEPVEKSSGEVSAPTQDKAPQSSEEPSSTAPDTGRLKASPLAKRIAADKGVNLAEVKGTGPGGRIVKEDVLKAATARSEKPAPASSPVAASASSGSGSQPAPASSAPAPAGTSYGGGVIGGEDTLLKVSNMRGTIARRLLESKTSIPHFYLSVEVDVGPLLAMRQEINRSLGDLAPAQGGLKLTVNDFILKASTEALRRVPAANSSWEEKSIRQFGAVHMAFAVAVEEGLVTPTIRNAHEKSIRQISIEARQLAKKARDKKLTPAEMTGSTFTVTNLGMYGIDFFYGIINPPNGAILSVGGTVKKPVVDKNNAIVVGERMTLGLSGDHRVVDGAVAAQFLAQLRALLESPAALLV